MKIEEALVCVGVGGVSSIFQHIIRHVQVNVVGPAGAAAGRAGMKFVG